MVLKLPFKSIRRPRIQIKKRSTCGIASGFTVVELLVAIFLAALVAGIGFAVYLNLGRQIWDSHKRADAELTARARMETLRRQLLTAGSLEEVSSTSISFTSGGDRQRTLEWDGRILKLDEKPWDSSLVDFSVTVYGPILPAIPMQSDNRSFSYSGWDLNGDGRLDVDELDRDRSGLLEGEECRMVGLLRVEAVWLIGGDSSWIGFEVHPRNAGK